jgi:hypothetical protein
MITDTTNEAKWEWVGTIETATGNYADIINIEPDMLTMEDIATSLSNICRFNGHLPNFYSVAEHSVRVAWWLNEQGYSDDIVLTGLLHDAAEAYVGDMMRPLKRLPQMEAVFKPIEESVMKIIHQKFGGIYPHPEVIHHADRATYLWEADHIRSGSQVGFSPELAYELFMGTYEGIMSGTEHYMEDEEITNHRTHLLEMATGLVNGDRNVQYGDPNDDFRRTATYWSTHVGGVLRRKLHVLGYSIDEEVWDIIDTVLDTHDVAIMMGQLKDSRLAWDPNKQDTWADKAGYAACGYDCVVRSS